MIGDIIAGVFMGALTGMGIGGGGLLVLYLTGIRNLDQLSAQGCNLLFFVFSSAAALFIHQKKRSLDFKMIGAAALLAVIGSQIGVRLTGVVPESVIKKLFGAMLIIAGGLAGARLIWSKENK